MAEKPPSEPQSGDPAMAEIEAALRLAIGAQDGVRRPAEAREALRRLEQITLARFVSECIAADPAGAVNAQARKAIDPDQISPPIG